MKRKERGNNTSVRKSLTFYSFPWLTYISFSAVELSLLIRAETDGSFKDAYVFTVDQGAFRKVAVLGPTLPVHYVIEMFAGQEKLPMHRPCGRS